MQPRSLPWLLQKAFKYIFARPLQRFNIFNRSKKYLGPDAPKFKVAPRWGIELGPVLPKVGVVDASEAHVIEAASRFRVQSIPAEETEVNLPKQIPSQLDRPLPKLTSLPLDDVRNLWIVEKVQPGKLDMNKLQELMINILADENYWTVEKISEHYAIDKKYAEYLLKYLKQYKILISPRIHYCLELAGRDNEFYQTTKNTLYQVDLRLRSKEDRAYDGMFEPDIPDEEIRRLIQPVTQIGFGPQKYKIPKFEPDPFRQRLPEPLPKPKPPPTAPRGKLLNAPAQLVQKDLVKRKD